MNNRLNEKQIDTKKLEKILENVGKFLRILIFAFEIFLLFFVIFFTTSDYVKFCSTKIEIPNDGLVTQAIGPATYMDISVIMKDTLCRFDVAEGNNFKEPEIINRFAYKQPEFSFRQEYERMYPRIVYGVLLYLKLILIFYLLKEIFSGIKGFIKKWKYSDLIDYPIAFCEIVYTMMWIPFLFVVVLSMRTIFIGGIK